MAETIFVGTTSRIKASFYGFDADGNSVLVDPDIDVTVEVRLSNAVVSTAIATRLSIGVFFYDWTPNVIGNFTIVFATEVNGIPRTIEVQFEVIDSSGVSTTQNLGEDTIVTFMPYPDPMFVDIDQLALLFPAAEPAEIAELIFDFTNEVIELTGLSTPTPLMREYVAAATACALSRIYDDLGLADQEDFQLGDLHITQRRQPKNKVPTRATATTWCELAGVLRLELGYSKSPMKTYVKGANVIIPMPSRQLKHQEWRSWNGD